ncbi:beta-eliminating lyase-related protein [Novosphingobium sp. 1949]|uniref:Beta-eliminating lyase-related protein n=1 Tax=Novosphingobium organovorum TaxID=2930092 RepID=A0ABT0BIH6_9SPHN|nr:beta-eliminating lyase-related protein [Novosphingobium organovorum]MCJ2184725.1 beta-eliminating lyase-related protein [Novosphingobium organovorum]
MTEPDALAAERTRLRLTCRHLAGHGPVHPAEPFEAIAAWLRRNGPQGGGLQGGDADWQPGVEPDYYGTGPLVEDFEAEVAALFALPAARFMPSGCMAQPIALRIWSERAGNRGIALHPTSHLELHEQHAYRELHGLHAHLLGEAHRPTTCADLAALIGPDGAAAGTGLASLLVELPAREIGGELPAWDDLVALSVLCRTNGIRLHLDGARVWQAAPAYGRSLAQIAALFDSVYVSFYKDVGALAGAMLLGPRDFIDAAAVWQRRQGGTLHSAMGNIVSARLNLAASLERMAPLAERARTIAALFARHAGVCVTPDPPHTSMFHLTLDGEEAALLAARDRAARETGIWLFSALRPVADGAAWTVEIALGQSSLALGDEELARAIGMLF